MGQDVRAWPMLALLLLVVCVAIGCVLWFMREAMRNERMAVRQKLAEAYRGHLALAQQRVEAQWHTWLREVENPSPNAAHFARCVRQGLAESVICFGPDGTIVYPREARPPAPDAALAAEALQARLRSLVTSHDTEATVQFILKEFGDGTVPALDANGRLISANAELMAMGLLTGTGDPRRKEIAKRLQGRLDDYDSDTLPSAQRRFLMRELESLESGLVFPTLGAEELAAQYLEAHPAPVAEPTLRALELRDVWSVASPSRRVLALLTTRTLGAKLAEEIRGVSLPNSVSVRAVAPGEDAVNDWTLVTTSIGPELPGWRLTLALDDRALFETAADQRVTRYLVIGSIVSAAMMLIALMVGRGFGRQVQLARLKNDLVATVSHELKTPLTAMRALVDTLLDTERLDEATTRDYLQLVAQENARLSRLIDNFLTFSRLQRNKFNFAFAPVRPEVVVAGAISALGERGHRPGCIIESRTATNLPAIKGDGDALITALLNLLDNAWKYSGTEKRITLRTETDDGSVRFVVKDNGVGLSPEEKRRVFDRFYQADRHLSRSGTGCGLGLSIVQSIVEAHRGSIHVESERGCGSTFTMKIPALSESAS